MKKQEFKIGDKVRCLTNRFSYIDNNGIYTIRSISYHQGGNLIFIFKEVSSLYSYDADYFEPYKKQIIEFL